MISSTSLATRCSACGTAFRVVQDQLKVSEGWVRCGRCNEVFNALEGLVDLQRQAPADAPAPPAAPPPEPEVRDTPAAAVVAVPADAIDVPASSAPAAADAPMTAALPGDTGVPATTDANIDADADADAVADAASDAAAIPDVDTVAPFDAEPAPDFMRSTPHGARWQHPKVRAGLALAALALLLALALQAGHHFRDTLVARWPAAKPLLLAWCGALGCTIEAPRRIDDVAVESSALTRADAPDAFTLSVALRNRGSLAVALPSVDLSLTDATGQLVARRVLSPREFGARATTLLAPGGEATLQALLTAGSARVTGYTVELFYP